MKLAERAGFIVLLKTFSILNGSNGNETAMGTPPPSNPPPFQYPQRIEWQ